MTIQSDPRRLAPDEGRDPGEGAPPQSNTDGNLCRNDGLIQHFREVVERDGLEQAALDLIDITEWIVPPSLVQVFSINLDDAENLINEMTARGLLERERDPATGLFKVVRRNPEAVPPADICPFCLQSTNGPAGDRFTCLNFHPPDNQGRALRFVEGLGYVWIARARTIRGGQPIDMAFEALYAATHCHQYQNDRSRSAGATRPEGRTGAPMPSPASPGTDGTRPGGQP